MSVVVVWCLGMRRWERINEEIEGIMIYEENLESVVFWEFLRGCFFVVGDSGFLLRFFRFVFVSFCVFGFFSFTFGMCEVEDNLGSLF